MTAYTLRADDAGLAGGRVKDDGLVPAVVTRDLTAATAHTLFPVKLRIDDSLAVKVSGCDEDVKPFAHHFGKVLDASLGHPALQA